MGILEQLGELFLQGVPTVAIVFLFYLFLRGSFFKPLERVMAERAARIEGAKHVGKEAQRTAEEKEKEYQEALKALRAEIYARQEKDREEALAARVRLIQGTRERAQHRVQQGKREIAAEEAAARRALEKESEVLAAEIVRAILPPGLQGGAR